MCFAFAIGPPAGKSAGRRLQVPSGIEMFVGKEGRIVLRSPTVPSTTKISFNWLAPTSSRASIASTNSVSHVLLNDPKLSLQVDGYRSSSVGQYAHTLRD